MMRMDFELKGGRLFAHCGEIGLDESRPVGGEDVRKLGRWAATYREAIKKRPAPDAKVLLEAGREMYRWLDGDERWLARAKEGFSPPVLLELIVPAQPSKEELAFVEAPWELLADDAAHLAHKDDVACCPVRRFGPAGKPAAASKYRLSAIFMAAAPRGQRDLRYEEEESAVLRATGTVGMDLTVEESGTLGLLAETLGAEPAAVDVLHVSCHGKAEPHPHVLLEDEVGDPKAASADDLADKLAGRAPRLLLVSACETAQADHVLNSLAATLIHRGFPAVLGWGGPVSDGEATAFAAALYEHLALGEALEEAIARARTSLIRASRDSAAGVSRDWHLARLYLGARGGGALCGGRRARRRYDPAYAYKAFLNDKAREVPVAGPHEFVGRRRQIQEILRTFRGHDRKGVFIHGIGRQGKSSLAARVAQRMGDHELLVLHGHYDAAAVLGAFAAFVQNADVAAVVKRHRDAVRGDRDGAALRTALHELLVGPCRDVLRDDAGKVTHRPVLLVIDDFEQALDESAEGPYRVKADLVPAVRAVIEAFGAADTQSRLLFTSRYTFALPAADGRELFDELLDLPLPAMEEFESRKQAGAKERARAAAPKAPAPAAADPKRTKQVIEVAKGNPGLQDLLFTMALGDAEACDRAVGEMRAYLARGERPSEEEVVRFLQNLAIGGLVGVLSEGERELLRASTLFELPVSLAVFEALCAKAALGAGREAIVRLLGLSLWELHEDLVLRGEPAAAVNALVRPAAGELTDAEERHLASLVLSALLEHWGGTDRMSRPYAVDHELARLGLIAEDVQVLSAAGADAVRWLARRNEYLAAADLGRRAVAVLDAAGAPAPPDLLRFAGEQCERTGDVATARTFFDRAIAALREAAERGEAVDPEDLGGALIARARRLVHEGHPDEALAIFEEAGDILKGDRFRRERAIVLGERARILRAKGRPDEALKLHEEQRDIFEQLGDTRERAVTLGDIARILTDKGRPDEALKLLNEKLGVCEQLGDTRERAVTLGDIARILTAKGRPDEALKLHEERLAAYEQLGDRRERAVTLGDIARILRAKGRPDEALKLHEETLAICEQLGDTRSRAVTLGDIAKIKAAKGELDEAMKLLEERLAVTRELGHADGIAAALWDMARIELGREDAEKAFPHLTESYAILLRIGRLEGITVVGAVLGQFLCAGGNMQEGLEVLRRSREGYTQLGRGDRARQVQEVIDHIEAQQDGAAAGGRPGKETG